MKRQNDLIIFLIITYAIPFFMAIPMAVCVYMGKDISVFPVAQMFYPAAGVMLAKLVCEGENPLLPRKFFISFLVLTGIMVFWCFAGFFLPDGMATEGSGYSILAGTIVLACFYFSEKKEKRVAYKLIGKNWRISAYILILFVILTYGTALIFSGFMEGLSGAGNFLSDTIKNLPWLLTGMLFSILSISSFFGEEYGWRTYFQPLLQKKFGIIRGVILFGILWEFWHLPLVFFYYSPANHSMSLLQMIVMRYLINILMAIFMAYAYMKTQNVWLPVLIHFVNNLLATGEANELGEFSWIMLGVLLLIKVAFYLPFLFSKVFRG